MANNNKKEVLKKTIAPEQIVMDDDSDMPKPETKVYKKYLKVTDKFMRLFGQCVSTLPYESIVTNKDGGSYRLIDFVRFIEQHKDKMTVEDMNIAISYIANMNFSKVRPLMEIIEAKERQGELWSVFEDM